MSWGRWLVGVAELTPPETCAETVETLLFDGNMATKPGNGKVERCSAEIIVLAPLMSTISAIGTSCIKSRVFV